MMEERCRKRATYGDRGLRRDDGFASEEFPRFVWDLDDGSVLRLKGLYDRQTSGIQPLR